MRSAIRAASIASPTLRRTPKKRMIRQRRLRLNRADNSASFLSRSLPGRRNRDVESLFTECARELIVKRFDEIGHHRALAGLHEGFDRHAGNKTHVTEPRDLLRRHADADGVVARAA